MCDKEYYRNEEELKYMSNLGAMHFLCKDVSWSKLRFKGNIFFTVERNQW